MECSSAVPVALIRAHFHSHKLHFFPLSSAFVEHEKKTFFRIFLSSAGRVPIRGTKKVQTKMLATCFRVAHVTSHRFLQVR